MVSVLWRPAPPRNAVKRRAPSIAESLFEMRLTLDGDPHGKRESGLVDVAVWQVGVAVTSRISPDRPHAALELSGLSLRIGSRQMPHRTLQPRRPHARLTASDRT
ncbi:hypothetical protein BL253_35225 [Pseudofrankia asymbiotica]|uniref:Uncharacterized protein n=1 Tax=Pseudofrankia asymbiotica TaxID=1834516 RepID=A0A1V2I0I8_9ACTN|nr:hypothetical protein BL253_35225 [Pseudofrankia asymbiotica]